MASLTPSAAGHQYEHLVSCRLCPPRANVLGSAFMIGTNADAVPMRVRSSNRDTRETAREVLLAFLKQNCSTPFRHLHSMLEPTAGRRAKVISTPQQNATIMSCWPCHPPLSSVTKLKEPGSRLLWKIPTATVLGLQPRAGTGGDPTAFLNETHFGRHS